MTQDSRIACARKGRPPFVILPFVLAQFLLSEGLLCSFALIRLFSLGSPGVSSVWVLYIGS